MQRYIKFKNLARIENKRIEDFENIWHFLWERQTWIIRLEATQWLKG